MTHEDPPATESVTVLECAQPHRLVLQWVQEHDQGWRVDVDLAPEGEGATLVFSQVFPPGTDGTDYALGWHWYLDKLDAVLTGGRGPVAWAAFEAATRHVYA